MVVNTITEIQICMNWAGAKMGFLRKSRRALAKDSDRKLVKKMIKKAREHGF